LVFPGTIPAASFAGEIAMPFNPEHDVQDLILQLQDHDVDLRLDALALVSDLGNRDDLEDPVVTVTDCRTSYRYEVGEADEPSRQMADLIEAVIGALQDDNVQVRRMAVLALGDIGPLTPRVVPALIQCLKDASADVRRRAAITLGELHADEACRALQQALRDDDERVRKAAIQALDEFDD
jgi:HEAT repeat protein